MKTFLNVLWEIWKAVLRVLKISFLFFSIIIVLYVCRELFFHFRYIQQDDNSDPMNYWTYAYLIDINWKTIETKYNWNWWEGFILVSLVLTWYDNKNLKDIERTFFPSGDEKHILDTRYTQWLNYAMFSVPISVGKFWFNAKLNYYSWESIDTFNLLWGPIVTIWPDTKQPNIPLVTLKADKSNAKVWEEVTFEVISDVFSHADDFEENRVIEIDFEWDGEYDLTTNNNIIKHTYNVASPTAYPYRPEASVIYDDYKWHWEWKPIIVKI